MNTKKLTLVYPYYDNPVMFGMQLEEWVRYPKAVKACTEFIVIDDCSTKKPAIDVVRANQACFQAGIQFRLYRITIKVPWNWVAARNIGCHEADDCWLFITDMDQMLKGADAEAVVKLMMDGQLKVDAYYTFSRFKVDGTEYKVHPNTYLLSKELYWRVGGYEEDFAGLYGSDGNFRRRIRKWAFGGNTHFYDIKTVYYDRDTIPDSGCFEFPRKEGRDQELNKAYMKKGIELLENDKLKAKTMTFPYERLI